MIYICCIEELYKYFKDYIKSIQSKCNIIIIVKNKEDIFMFMKEIAEKDKCYKFILFTISNMGVYNISYFNKKQIYILNTEQLSRDSEKEKIENYKKQDYKLIDYSQSNISLSKTLLYLPYQVNFKEIPNYKKIYNACYIGTLFSSYRYNILKTLNISILGTKNQLWGHQRDNVLFRHKVLVNIHHDKNYTICEEMRINRCIFNRMIVITEECFNCEDLYLKKYMIIEKPENIKKRLDDVLLNYDTYYKKIYGNFDIKEINHHYKNHLKQFIQEITK